MRGSTNATAPLSVVGELQEVKEGLVWDTWYQNTTGRTLFASVRLSMNGGGTFKLDISPGQYHYYVFGQSLSYAGMVQLVGIIPKNWYFMISRDNTSDGTDKTAYLIRMD